MPLILLLLSGCSADPGVADTAAAAPIAVEVQSALWRMDWDAAGVEAGADGWSFTSDLGQRVRIERGWVTTYGATLVPCPEADTGRWRPSDLLFGRAAWAGHSGAEDGSALAAGYVEDLAAPARITLGEATFEPARYCEVHHVLGPATDDSGGALAAGAMLGLSLRLEGAWQPAGGGEEAPFLLEGGSAYGLISDLSGALVVGSGPDATVTFVRRQAGLLDGIDLASADPGDAAYAVLRNLVEQAEIEILLSGDTP